MTGVVSSCARSDTHTRRAQGDVLGMVMDTRDACSKMIDACISMCSQKSGWKGMYAKHAGH